jgi:pimeloyl-ACP methyl ester carboxylesterase
VIRSRPALVVLALAALPACKREGPPRPPPRPPDSRAAPPDLAPAKVRCPRRGRQVITLTTDDKLRLEADLYLAGGPGAPAAVLLHMIPPHHDRRNYPQSFIDALLTRKVTVLNLDRRGAGRSQGEAREAYRGPKGWLDARAAHDLLARHSCVDRSRIVYVGASNGTTTALDLAVRAARHPEVTPPRALVFLTGGSYTEAQHKIADHRALVERLPLMFVFSTVEGQWARRLKQRKASPWRFLELPGLTKAQGHGTRIFTARPAAVDAVADFVAAAVR